MINKLGESIRKIQVIGDLRGTSLFSQDIESIRIFQKEIEKLRMKIAKMRGEKFFSSDSGLTSEMIQGFNKISKAVSDSENKIKALNTIIDQMRRKREAFDALAKNVELTDAQMKKLKTSSRDLVVPLEKVARAQIMFGKGREKIEALAVEYQRLEKILTQELNKIGVSVSKNTVNFETFEKKGKEAITILAESMGRMAEGASRQIQELAALYQKSSNQIVAANKKMLSSGMKAWSDLAVQEEQMKLVNLEISKTIKQLHDDFNRLQAIIKVSNGEFQRTTENINLLNRVIKTSESLVRSQTGEFQRSAREILEWANTFKQSESKMGALKKVIRSTEDELARIRNEFKMVEAAEKALQDSTGKGANSQEILRRKIELTRAESKVLYESLVLLSGSMDKMNRLGRISEKEMAELKAKITETAFAARLSSKNIKILNDQLERLSRRSVDANRALGRLESEGFAYMILSQTAWMAGFQLIFGTLDEFKKALRSVVDEQEAVTRAMRTARSEVMSASEMWDAYTKTISNARMKTGIEIEELGEIMYQLGSAGLSAEESVAALDSTLANIIGTEAEVRDITKLIAGIYNNFADQIVKIDGQVRTISNTWDGYEQHVVSAATKTEKFTKINDLLVGAFKNNQVEMNELRDGLKFMAQSAKIANLSLSDMVGILAFLNNHLIKAGTAGRAVRVILSRITKDARGFADAFDIDIDLTKPLDFMKIIDQIHEKLKNQQITVEDIGKIFKRLGLRGAESFALLVTQTERLRDTIEGVKNTTKDATDEMMKVRLDNFARQSEIAAAKIEGLLKKGLRPVIKTAELVVTAFNKIISVLTFLDNAFGGVLSTILKWAGITGMLTAIYYAFKNVGIVVKWFKAVLITLIANMKKFGDSVLQVDGEVKKHEISIRRVTSALREYNTAVIYSAKTSYNASRQFQGVSKSIATYNAISSASITLTKKLRTTILGLSSAVKAIGMMFIWMIAIDIITYFINYDEVLDKAVKKQQKLVESTKKNIDGLQTLSDKLDAASKGTGDYNKVAREVAKTLGIYIPKNESLTITYEKLNKKLKKNLDIQKELLKIRLGKFIEAELDKVNSALKDLSTEDVYQSLKDMQMVFSSASGDVDILGNKIASLDKHIGNLEVMYKALITAMKQYEEAGAFVNSETKEEVENLKDVIETRKKQRDGLIALQHLKQIDAGLISNSIALQQREAEARRRNKKEQEKIVKIHISEMNSLRSLIPIINSQINSIKNLGKETEKYYFLLNNAAIYQSIGKYKEMEDVIDKIVEKKKDEIGTTEKSITFILKELNSTKDLTEYQKQRLQSLNDVFESQKNLNREQIRAIEYIRDQIKANNDLIISLDKLKAELPEIERGFSNLQNEMNIYRDLMKKIEQYTKGAGVSLDDLGKYFELTVERMEKLSESGAIEEFNDKMDSLKDKLKEIERQGSPFDVQKWLGDLEKLGNKGKRIFESLYDRINEIRKEIQQSKKWNIEINLKIDAIIDREADKYIDTLRKKFEELLKKSNKWSYEVINAYNKYKKALQDVIRKQEEELKTAQKAAQAAQKATNEAIEKARNEALAAEERYKAAKKAKEQINNEIEAQKEALKRARERYEKEIELISAKERAGRLSEAVAAAARKKAERELEAAKNKALNRLKELKLKAEEVARLTENLGKKAIIPLKEQMEAILDQMAELQRMAKEGIQLDYSEISNAISEAKILNDSLMREIEKIINTNPTMNTLLQKAEDLNKELSKSIDKHIYYHEHNKPQGSGKFYGGQIKLAKGGMVPAMVTHGEGYISPDKVQGHLAALARLNTGGTTSAVPEGIRTFIGKRGIDKIPTYLPSGSYVLSKKGMDAYERSMNSGAKKFQSGGPVLDTGNNQNIKEIPQEDIYPEQNQNFGTLTIVVEKSGSRKEFPVMGKPYILKGLREELEEERLTKLH